MNNKHSVHRSPPPSLSPSFRTLSLFCSGQTDNDEKTRRKNCTWQSDSTIPLICALHVCFSFSFGHPLSPCQPSTRCAQGLRKRLAGLLFLIQKEKKREAVCGKCGHLWRLHRWRSHDHAVVAFLLSSQINSCAPLLLWHIFKSDLTLSSSHSSESTSHSTLCFHPISCFKCICRKAMFHKRKRKMKWRNPNSFPPILAERRLDAVDTVMLFYRYRYRYGRLRLYWCERVFNVQCHDRKSRKKDKYKINHPFIKLQTDV